ncbi:MAG: Biotin transporter BioY [Chlamydiae bacterium]|nr:Biotin transporter BioY [Chlamydiota bacterium]
MLIHRSVPMISVSNILAVGYGFFLLLLASWVRIPFYPISFTGHTLAIFILALTQTPKQAAGSVLCYLVGGSLGLPVFAGIAKPLWFLGKSAGYYISFPIAAYLIASLAKKIPSWLAIFFGQLVIYTCGFLGLLSFVGVYVAFMKGVVFFIPSAILKMLVAPQIAKFVNKKRDL